MLPQKAMNVSMSDKCDFINKRFRVRDEPNNPPPPNYLI